MQPNHAPTFSDPTNTGALRYQSGFGNEFPEIKELNRCSKAVRLNWINRHNLMLKEKKEKKIEQGKTNN